MRNMLSSFTMNKKPQPLRIPSISQQENMAYTKYTFSRTPASIIMIFLSDSICYVFISSNFINRSPVLAGLCGSSSSSSSRDNCDGSMSILSIWKSLILMFKICATSISLFVPLVAIWISIYLSSFHHWFGSSHWHIWIPHSKCSLKSHSNWNVECRCCRFSLTLSLPFLFRRISNFCCFSMVLERKRRNLWNSFISAKETREHKQKTTA